MAGEPYRGFGVRPFSVGRGPGRGGQGGGQGLGGLGPGREGGFAVEGGLAEAGAVGGVRQPPL
jgi:hypothetical protein